MSARAPTASLHALVAGLVDYAGLFPPAALSMQQAVTAYAAHRGSPEGWMLGRFVVPIARLDEFEEVARGDGLPRGGEWHLAALAGAEPRADGARAGRFNAEHRGRFGIDVIEVKAASVDEVARAVRELGAEATLHVELPLDADPALLLGAVRDAGARAKMRTGGITAGAIPSVAQVARFLASCARLDVPFKATAGLHHPIRAEYRLTYEADAERALMFGFLNVFAAAVFARAGMPEAALSELLDERDAGALQFSDAGLRWRDHALTTSQVADARSSFAIAFGSCSFQEPVDDLHQLALL